MPSGFLNEDSGATLVCNDCDQQVRTNEHHACLGEAVPPARQRTMFSGLDCLPGQQDLFPTDGE